MGDTKFTLIELHLGDTQFGLGTIDSPLPFGSSDAESESETETEYETRDAADETSEAADEGGSKATGAIVALVVLVAAGVAAKKFRGDDDEPELEDEEQPNVIAN